ncbi:hypothetical protein GQ53DRAFT_832449 [Thozetella sp. PMI_491]|nr:hypothetical protein GQ53DRAFT_832449 [Thozetella sp. PMI_491]
MAPPGFGYFIVQIYSQLENMIVQQILRSPTFHRGVRSIHRRVEDYRYGRDPNEPLRPGEATEEPSLAKGNGFLKHFVDELRNQARGAPSNPPPPPTSPPKR